MPDISWFNTLGKEITMLCLQGTMITKEMLPAIVKLVEHLRQDGLVYVGLSNTTLTKAHAHRILEVLFRKETCSAPEQKKLVLELQQDGGHDWLTSDLKDGIINAGQQRGVEIILSVPDLSQHRRKHRRILRRDGC